MKTPIAILNLWHQGAKTLVSTGGVAFALLLVFMQLGFMGAVSHTATNVLSHLKFDILIRARDYLHLYEPSQIDRQWLAIAASTRGVSATHPFWITIHNWRGLPTAEEQAAGEFDIKYLPIAVMAFEPEANVFDLPDIQQAIAGGKLSRDSSLLIDDSTQADYGPLHAGRFSAEDVGRQTEIGGRQFTIHGLFKLGTGLAANGAAVTSHHGFARITPWDVRHTTSIGLVQVDGGPEQVALVLDRLRERTALSSDGKTLTSAAPTGMMSWFETGNKGGSSAGAVTVLSRDEALELENKRWLWQTPIGLIFQLGVLLSLLVGGAIVYMVLSTDVANRLPEYATLLAIGYSRLYLASIVMTQAIVLSLLGFLAAWAAAELLYRLTTAYSNIPLIMEPLRIASVGGLGLLMCCTSGLFALRKLWKAEPASLF
ncbi:MAG: FtsX-like permease family protein [Pirellulaceae bacterium]